MAQKSKKAVNKNQTTAARAAEKSARDNRPTKRVCESEKCPTPGQPILAKDLCPVVTAPKRRTLFFHKNCWDKR